MFSARVLAAANSSDCGREVFTKAFLQQPLGLGFGRHSTFAGVKGIPAELHVSGMLQGDLLHFKAGTKVSLKLMDDGVCTVRDDSNADTYSTYYGIVLGHRRTHFREV